MVDDELSKLNKRDIVITKRIPDTEYPLKFVNENLSMYDPLAFPLIHLFGEPGWQYQTYVKNRKDISNPNADNIDNLDHNTPDLIEVFKKPKYISAREFYSFRLQDRNGKLSHFLLLFYSYNYNLILPGSHLQKCGRLYHEYIVDNYAKIEMGRLNFLRLNQKNLRADLYKNICDAINSDETNKATDIGKTVILPSSFSGGPRHMEQLFQDAMACMRIHGKPDLFVTFTTNPKWPEIINELEDFQTPNDRPDLIAKVFNIKLKALLEDLLIKKVLGAVSAHIYVIEWQKRGLPHAHILLCLEERDKIKTTEHVNSIVSAEIPDKTLHKLAYETVSTCLMHGPCGIAFPNAPCMIDGKCSKHFPKASCQETILANDKYPIYRRRNDSRYIHKNGIDLDNQWVVPHNLYLTTKYNAHINVEICNTIGAVKYLFKYVYKGLLLATSFNNI